MSLTTIAKRYLNFGLASKKYGAEIAAAIDKATAGTSLSDTIENGVTNLAPTSNAVYDALALKAVLSGPTFTTPSLGDAVCTTLNALTPTSATTGFTIAGGTTSRTLTVNTTVKTSELALKAAPVLVTPTLGAALATSINTVGLVKAAQATTSGAGVVTITGLTTNAVVICTGAEATANVGYVVATANTLTVYIPAGTVLISKKVNYLVISN